MKGTTSWSVVQQFRIMCNPNTSHQTSAPLDFYYHIERAIYQLATALQYNKYLSYLSKNGGLLREKKGRDVIVYWRTSARILRKCKNLHKIKKINQRLSLKLTWNKSAPHNKKKGVKRVALFDTTPQRNCTWDLIYKGNNHCLLGKMWVIQHTRSRSSKWSDPVA